MSDYQTLTGKVHEERQRWRSEQGDTLVLGVWIDGEDDPVSVKVRETVAPIFYRGQFAFFGKWGKYWNKGLSGNVPQFQAFAYCPLNMLERVKPLMELLMGRGFPKDLGVRVAAEGVTAERVRKNPFCLLPYRGAGFRRCDKMWLDMGRPKLAMKRQTLCLAHSLRNGNNGSVWHSEDSIRKLLIGAMDSIHVDTPRAVRLGVRAGLLDRETVEADGSFYWDGDIWIAGAEQAKQEQEIVSAARWMTSRCDWPGIDQGKLTDHQFAEVRKAMSSNLGILTGGGGTGKTFTTAQVIAEIVRRKGASSVALCAPTGKAAVRMSEAIGAYGIDVQARTTHSLLQYRGDSWGMPDLADEDIQFVFSDESSMNDLELTWRLLACARRCCVMLIGDPYQLPPVGCGAPFRDLIEVLPSRGHLEETHRNAGAIVAAGKLIRDGLPFEVYDSPEAGNLVYREAVGAQRVVDMVLGEIRAAEHRGFNPVWDVQVLVQVNQRSELSTSELNKRLQAALNPNAPVGVFALGDKVMNTSGSWLLEARKYPGTSTAALRNSSDEIYVANGDIGKVIEVTPKYLVVEVMNPTRYVMAGTWETDPNESDEGDTGSHFVLGYAITTHKSQGSQWPVVINVIDEYAGARRLMDRSMVYTANSRATDYTVIVGKLRSVLESIKRATIWDRKTLLKERWNHEMAKADLQLAAAVADGSED